MANRLQKRDERLAAEAAKVIGEHVADRAPEATVAYVRLKILLEVQTILCTEYRFVCLPIKALIMMFILLRDSYFAIIALMGATIFNFVQDHHLQQDGVLEAEAAVEQAHSIFYILQQYSTLTL